MMLILVAGTSFVLLNKNDTATVFPVLGLTHVSNITSRPFEASVARRRYLVASFGKGNMV